MLNEIVRAQHSGVLRPGIPIFAPSTTAVAITRVYREQKNAGWFRPEIASLDAPWSPAGLIEPPEQVPEPIPRPSVLITTSGMMDAAMSKDLAIQLLPDPGVTVFVVGWAGDPQSPGGRLRDGARHLEIDGADIEVRASVKPYSYFSAHGDASDIDRWLSHVPRETEVFLVHGELSNLRDRRAQLLERGFRRVVIPKEGETLYITSPAVSRINSGH